MNEPALTPLQRTLHHPLRMVIAAIIVMLVSMLAWIWLGATTRPLAPQHWYGDEFAARGFDKRTVGRALVQPTREQGAQRIPSVSILENLSISAQAFPTAQIETFDRDGSHRIAIIWRNSIAPTVTQRLDLDPGTHPVELIRLASHPGWKGTITGLGLAAGHPNSATLLLVKFAVLPNTPANRAHWLLGETQVALKRPIPGQESVARALRISPFAWMAGSTSLLATVVAVWFGLRSRGTPIFIVVLAFCSALILIAEGARVVGTVGRGAATSELTRASTLAAINAALKPNQATGTSPSIHVWSGDGRGHEIALATAPTRAAIRLAEDTLPSANLLRVDDLIVVLARRGVKFSPNAGTLDWLARDGIIQQIRAELLYAGNGDAVFKVRS